MTKGRWHGSSLRDGLHLRSRAGRARDQRETREVPRPADPGRQRHRRERGPLGQAHARLPHQEEGLGRLRRGAVRGRRGAASRVRARRQAGRGRAAVPGRRVGRPAGQARPGRGRDRDGGRGARGGRSVRRPAKTCPVCESGVRVLDYKDDRTLGRFLTERGKILPSRLSGMCARHQRQLATAIKRARQLALLPYIKGYVG
ncbi:MAG: 30S ribosomal protein S18 [Gemmatimonadetes bacterium]|nr:MAG: 30S ribosomal protein S18 [Gemmatimonadota bacterium]